MGRRGLVYLEALLVGAALAWAAAGGTAAYSLVFVACGAKILVSLWPGLAASPTERAALVLMGFMQIAIAGAFGSKMFLAYSDASAVANCVFVLLIVADAFILFSLGPRAPPAGPSREP